MNMAGFGGFYKGEKKKQKKDKDAKSAFVSNTPVFVLPEVISKKSRYVGKKEE